MNVDRRVWDETAFMLLSWAGAVLVVMGVILVVVFHSYDYIYHTIGVIGLWFIAALILYRRHGKLPWRK